MASSESDAAVELTLAGHGVRVSSPDKVFFTKRAETKRELIAFYEQIEPALMNALGRRATMMHRFPDGASGKSFFQKRVPKGAPDWLVTTEVSTPNGTRSDALVLADIAHVAWAVNLGCLGFHPWPFRVGDRYADGVEPVDATSDDPTERRTPPIDELRVDLDPSPGLGFDDVRHAAFAVRDYLDELGITSYVKTSGSKGLHVHVPLELVWDSYAVRRAAVALARELERRHPDTMTAQWWKEERGRRVFVDFNQNAPHKTVFGAWSVRPRVGAQVSTPLEWDELAEITPDSLTIASIPDRLKAHGDPWATMYDRPQSLDRLLDAADRHDQEGLMDAPWPPDYPKQPNEPPRVAPSRAKDDDASM